MINSCIEIPSRLESQRFPNKPLAIIAGKSMIRRVLEQGLLSSAELVLVATDSEKIYEECKGYSILTCDCSNGTERLIEVAKKINARVYINLQGDEPLASPADLDTLIQKCKEMSGIHTLMTDISGDDIHNSNVVKVLCKAHSDYNQCFLFSRTKESSYKHIGIYAFDRKTLLQIKKLKPSPNSLKENLEQLTWLESNIPIYSWYTSHLYQAVDVPEDINKVLSILSQK
jgi:3-deoxy-manno-octulosonate cytidylyltransferase (CMP-KDO synthetase)